MRMICTISRSGKVSTPTQVGAYHQIVTRKEAESCTSVSEEMRADAGNRLVSFWILLSGHLPLHSFEDWRSSSEQQSWILV